ncbi:sulfotransferase domain-containing protein [Salinibacter grassmerensis]|uniref:sulfotransferase domain-containing protein n=1 Tax=Salinibacter grassmerensis TaxID=3040353 RepID=UPI0021E72DF1|nr:sulfotransferase domain-containing protein [Salinibacter grassmerensis]
MQFVASYPKSGNTWIRLVAAAYHLSDEELLEFMESHDASADIPVALRYTDAERYQYQAVSPFPLSEMNFSQEVRLRPAAMLVLRREAYMTSTRRPVPIKSHHIHAEIDGIDLWNSVWTDRVVNPVRDPREVCCSFAAHRGMNYEETADLMADSKARMGEERERVHSLISSWSTHVRSWLSADDTPVHSVQYEDLAANPVDEFYNILEFMEAPDLTRDRVKEAVEQTRFDRMQELESEHGFPEKTADQEQFFRSGKTSGWEEELPSDVARKIEDDHGEMMEHLGYL